MEIYTSHFGFRERPFSLSPNPDYLYLSAAHERAMAVLEYGVVTAAPLTVLTGEVGMGKTTLIQALLRTITDEVTIALISNAHRDRGELLKWIMYALDIAPPVETDYISLFQRFQDFVLEEYGRGQRVVLVVDEAQNLGVEMLEELRLLTNINSGEDELLQIILVGQPELREIITKPEMRQFAQRVTITYHLAPFSRAESAKYIQHRLKLVGGSGNEISAQAVSAIHAEAEGIPRLINKLCDIALVYAAAADAKLVGKPIINELVRDGVILKPASPPYILTESIDKLKRAAE